MTGVNFTKCSLLALLLILVMVLPAWGDYSTFHGDSQRTGNASVLGPDTSNLLWTQQITSHSIYGGVAVSEDRVYVCDSLDMSFSGQQALSCLNATDGAIIWTNPIGEKGGSSTPTIAEDRVLVGSYVGDLYCLNVDDGSVMWNVTLEIEPTWWGLASSPLVFDGTIFATSFSDGALHALDYSGVELWNRSTDSIDPYSSPSGWDGKVYFAGGDPALYCLNSSSGQVLWTFETDAAIASSPAIEEGTVFFTTSNSFYAVDAENGQELWKVDLKGTPSTPAISFGKAYVGSSDGFLTCFDALNGTRIWSTEVNGPVVSSPVVAKENVYFGTNVGEGTVYALNATDGSVVWTHLINEYIMSSPAILNGTLFIGADDKNLYAFGPKEEIIESSKEIWAGEVLLPDGSFNLTSGSGDVYSIKWTTALGALQKASELGEFDYSVGDSMLDVYGLTLESVQGMGPDGDQMWKYWVNYPQNSVPRMGPDRFELQNGDVVTFYWGDRQADPEKSIRIHINTRIFLKRPEVLFITAENQPLIREASQDAPLNITLKSSDDIQMINLSSYELIFLEMIGGDAAQRLLPLMENPKNREVSIILIHSGGYERILGNVDLNDHPKIEEYWNFGGVDNMKRLFSYLGANFCDLDISVEDPLPSPKAYIFHPDSVDLFLDTASYLEWYKNNTDHPYNESALSVGVMNLASDPVSSSMRVALIRSLEQRGANVIDLGFTNTTTMKKFFIQNGTAIIDVAIVTKPFRLNYGDPKGGIADLEELNVPVINGMKLWYQNPDEWENSTGMYPTEIYFKLAQPEMDAVIDPIVISGRTEEGVFEVIPYQVEWLADRTTSWANLSKKPNSNKKVAIIYYNHGGGKDNLGATYINVPRSLQVILDGLNQSGYGVEGVVPNEHDLVDLMAHEGTNVGTWAPGELEAMVNAGNATLLPVERYLEWFGAINPEKQKEVTERWGPAPGEIMVYQNETGKYFVIPKLSFGNVILTPQPTRGWLQNNTILYHRKDIPPHHQYIAFYLWLKHEYGADFIVHLGKHGTQEWTPGKESGISIENCWPAILIQDLPVIYPYIVDNIAEGAQAKRRGDAVMITHMTPPIVSSDLYGNFTNLAKTAYNYQQVLNATVKENYKQEILAQCMVDHLDEDLGVNLTEISSDPVTFDEFVDELEHYLYDLKTQFMPYGLHTFSLPLEGQPLLEMVESMLRDDYKREVALKIGYLDYPNPARLYKEEALDNCTEELLVEVLLNGTSPEEAQIKVFGAYWGNNSQNNGSAEYVFQNYSSTSGENASEHLVSNNLTAHLELGLTYMEGLKACTMETDRFLNASESQYTPPSPADDPIRDPRVLPTGRNFHSISPREVPTPAAWDAGQKLADNLIEQYKEDNNGSYPQKMAIVLWAWAMTDHGVVESEILHLIGAKPVRDIYGGVSNVKLVPLSELGRPRIDVLVVPSGLDRDLFPEKLKFIDRAIRLANNDTDTSYPNYIKENSEDIKVALLATGNYSEEEADYLSVSRIFLEAAGTYGPNLESAISASDTWENDSKLGNLFIDRMSYIYGDDIWGSKRSDGKMLTNNVQKEIYELNLADVDAAAHHTNSNLYGFIDNDDVFQYIGGLGMAVRTVTGNTPPIYVTDVRDPSQQKVESLHDFFSKELRARYYNPKWMEGMMSQGYSGAREMDKFVEYLWGWDVTVPDLVTEAMWDQSYDVYVNDKYDMGLKEFFDQNNPYAYQVATARMLEAARKDYWHPTEEVKENLAEEFEKSEQEYGVTCCHHTCGNLLLREYMQGVLAGSESAQSSSSKKGGGGSSRHPFVPESPEAGTSNQTQSSGVGTTTAEKPVEAEPAQSDISGYVMEEVVKDASSMMPSISGAPLLGVLLVLFMLVVIGAGFKRKG